MAQTTFEEISASDFFYRNRDIAGFTSPSRAIFAAIRELVENSLDAAERLAIPRIKISANGTQTEISNFKEICEALKQEPKQLLEYLSQKTMTKAEFDGAKAVFLKELKSETLEKLIQIYAQDIVVCPDIYVRLSYEDNEKFESGLDGERKLEREETEEETETFETGVYKLRVEDNGTGVPPRHIPSAFGQVLFGSKYKLKQQRGTFGLGGKMAILYGQITTHQPASISSSNGMSRIYMYKLMIDIQKNRPLIIDRKILMNKEQWRGTIVEFCLEGDYFRAMPKILEYFKQTAMMNPYANLTFVDPKGRLYKFTRITKEMPEPPKETKPHPYGVDVELLQRLIQITPYKNMLEFLRHHFHRVGETTANKFLEFSSISPSKNPKKLSHEEVVRLMHMLKKFREFLPPDASCLSPLGEDLLKAGILKEIKPEFVAVHQRKPATYAGHPFIIEVGIAYGGEIPKQGSFLIYRFANRIPLLYDEASDVSVKVIDSMNWRRYKIIPDMPIAILVHVCSTKVPYKTVGKEFIADRPEVRREIGNGLREVARQLQHFLTRREHVDRERKRLGVFSKYLPKIAQFSTKLAGREKLPDIEKLLRSVRKFGAEET